MSDNINIPPEAVKALRPFTCCGCNKCLAKAIRAALAAWPGMRMMVDIDTGDDAAIKLPLNTENPDD